MDNLLKIREEHKKEEKARMEARKKAIKKMTRYIGSSTKRAAKLIGVKGAVGGLVGLATMGPIGGLAGIVAGKFSKQIWDKGIKPTYNLGHNLYDINDRAKKYEEINPDAKYTPKAGKSEEAEATSIEATSEPRETAPTRGTRRFREVLEDIGEDFDYLGKRMIASATYCKNYAGRINGKIENARAYSKLENEAKELSAKTGTKISPENLYALKIKQKEQEGKINSYKALKEKILLARVQLDRYDEKRTEENINAYNDLVRQHSETALELGITDPRQYFPLLQYQTQKREEESEANKAYREACKALEAKKTKTSEQPTRPRLLLPGNPL